MNALGRLALPINRDYRFAAAATALPSRGRQGAVLSKRRVAPTVRIAAAAVEECRFGYGLIVCA